MKHDAGSDGRARSLALDDRLRREPAFCLEAFPSNADVLLIEEVASEQRRLRLAGEPQFPNPIPRYHNPGAARQWNEYPGARPHAASLRAPRAHTLHATFLSNCALWESDDVARVCQLFQRDREHLADLNFISLAGALASPETLRELLFELKGYALTHDPHGIHRVDQSFGVGFEQVVTTKLDHSATVPVFL